MPRACPDCGSTKSKTETGNVLDAVCLHCGSPMYPRLDAYSYLGGVTLIAALGLAGCWTVLTPKSEAQAVKSIYWGDGDSGRIDGMDFRLADWDAPETGAIGSRGGAKCEKERELGYEAKAFMVELTRNKQVTITAKYDIDLAGRQVLDLAVDGKDIAQIGRQAGHLRS